MTRIVCSQSFLLEIWQWSCHYFCPVGGRLLFCPQKCLHQYGAEFCRHWALVDHANWRTYANNLHTFSTGVLLLKRTSKRTTVLGGLRLNDDGDELFCRKDDWGKCIRPHFQPGPSLEVFTKTNKHAASRIWTCAEGKVLMSKSFRLVFYW